MKRIFKMSMNKTEIFESAPIPKAALALSLPAVLSSLVMIIYNLADTFFVGMLNDPVQNSAVTLAAPLKILQRTEKRIPQKTAHQKPKAQLFLTDSKSCLPRERLIMLELPTPKRLFTALKARRSGAARVTAEF